MSLICTLGKVLEKIFKRRLLDHSMSCKILKYSQPGFIRGWSCLTSILDFQEEIYDKLSEGKLGCYCVYLKDDNCMTEKHTYLPLIQFHH